MKEFFFKASRNALDRLTDLYDITWPAAVGLWNLRWQVRGFKEAVPNSNEIQLAKRFAAGSGIERLNFNRAFFIHSWEKQQNYFAWIILNNAFSIYESWLEELDDTVFIPQNVSFEKKEFQFETTRNGSREISGIWHQIHTLTSNQSTMLKNAFYSQYINKNNNCQNELDNLMLCFRFFKESRNCYMHNSIIANQRLMDAYVKYSAVANISSLCVDEVPKIYQPQLNKEIKVSLRGIVGFTAILIKIIRTCDTELLISSYSEYEFENTWKQSKNNGRTLCSDSCKANSQIVRYVKQCGYMKPICVDEIKQFLLDKHLMYR